MTPLVHNWAQDIVQVFSVYTFILYIHFSHFMKRMIILHYVYMTYACMLVYV